MSVPKKLAPLLAVLALTSALSLGVPTATSSAPTTPVATTSALRGRGDLAFVSLGQLWVISGATADLRAVSAPGGEAADPQFSPDGKWLAYVQQASDQLYIAAADGASPHAVRGSSGGTWLPDGELLGNGGLWAVSPDGMLRRLGPAPPVAGVSPDGKRFAFVESTLHVSPPKASRGVEELEVASSLSGKRSLWLEAPVSFTAAGGLQGNFISEVVVLPGSEGILFWVDPGQSDAADGLGLYLLRAPRTAPKLLGCTLLPGHFTGWQDRVAIGPPGTVTITMGCNRYAWMNKTVKTCTLATGTCHAVPARTGELSFDPAWSPGGSALAYIEAPPSSASGFPQSTVASWYATHSLWLLPKGSQRPTEVAGAAGAVAPVWASDGKSLLFVSGDALWLLPSLTARPVKVAGPLFPPSAWPTYYGQVNWESQFAWYSAP